MAAKHEKSEPDLSTRDLSFRAFRHGWEAAIARAGGMVRFSWNVSLDWDQIIKEEFDGYWRAETKEWEAQAEIASQGIAHRLELSRSPQPIPVPHAIPAEKNVISGMEVE